jgi:hypothetical protein
VLRDLEEMKNRNKAKKEQEEKDKLYKKKHQEGLQRQAQKDLHKRNIEIGFIQKEDALFDEFTETYTDGYPILRKNNYTLQEMLNEFPLINPSEEMEESLEKDYINLLFVRHKASLVYLFNKYANSISKSNNKGTFDKMGKRASSMSVAEISKMLNDYDLGNLLNKEEISG